MKYSILVLGASISISLFIRICCSVETNALYKDKSESGKVFANIGNNEFGLNSEKLLIRHGENSYANFPKLTLQKNIRKLKPIGLKDSGADDADLVAQIKTHSKLESFDDSICGPTDSPTQPESCEGNCTTVTDFPEGCDYDSEDKILTCTDVDLRSIPFPSVLEKLDLSGSEAKNLIIPMYAFHNVSIKRISITGNAINDISPWAFDGVDDLEALLITNTQLTNLTYDMYVGLNELITMDLQHNEISWEVYQNCSLIEPVDKIRVVLPNLRVLHLSHNPLRLLPYQMFAGLRKSPLTTLSLEDCYFTGIHKDAFTFIRGLQTLNLSGNKGIKELTLEFIQPLTNLHTLYLERIGLTNFPRQALSGLKKLELLYLSDNEFLKITKSDLSDLTSLKELKMNDCGIKSIDDDAFEANTELTAISLVNNKLAQVPAYFPPSLTVLNISRDDGKITELHDAFHGLPNLKHLDLRNIGLDTIPSNSAFNEMTSLTKLFLESCNIQHIEEGAFQNLSILNTLFLKGNKISQISPEAFRGLNSLKLLNMDDCELTFSSYASNDSSLPSPFKHLPKLERLELTGNRIEELSSRLFQNTNTLKYLNLNDNPIQSWKTRLFPDRITTVYNLSARGDIYTFQVEMSRGEIQFVTDAMIEDFLRITMIDLTGNKIICGAGACKLRELIHASLPTEDRQKWVNKEDYICSDTSTSTNYKIMNVTEDVCKPKVGENVDEEDDPNEDGDQGLFPASSSTVTQLIIIAGSVSLVAVVVILLAYRNRVHLRYFWFKVKFNVMPVTPRKAKLSTMDSATEYDYDVFISYHNEDSEFIADVFLPEIEQQESKLEGGSETVEAKNEIFLIENDKMSIMRNTQGSGGSRMDNASKQNKKKFKVCLHERDFEAGVPITENIVDCVDRSRKMVIFVSKQYMESQWCSYEMNLVYHRLVESRRKSFALVLLEDIPSGMRSKVLNYLMLSKTYLQWPGMNGLDEDKSSFWRRLRAFLQSSD